MNKLKRVALASGFVLLAGSPQFAWADDTTDSSSECTTYLSWSTSDFVSNVSSSQSTAESVTNALSNCLHNNDCTTLSSSINNCDTLLSNRLFTASFYTSRFALEGSSGNSSMNSAAAPAPSATTSAPAESSSSSSSTTSSNASTSSDINW